VTSEEFNAMIEQHNLLEWAEVHGNRYGTLASVVRGKLDEGVDVVLEIDPQGALQVRKLVPEAVLVFITAPLEELERRIRVRGAETDEQVRTRLDTALREMRLVKSYDHVVENDDVRRAADELVRIVESIRSEEGCL
jgi:guanylate kinase